MANAFRMEELDGGIGLVTFDLPDKKVNTLSREVLQELAALVGQLEKRTDLRGLLLKSGKPGQFIAGADLNELAMLSYATQEQLTGHDRLRPPAFLADQPAAVSDGGPDRRRLPGRRNRAGARRWTTDWSRPRRTRRSACRKSRSVCCRAGAARSGSRG